MALIAEHELSLPAEPYLWNRRERDTDGLAAGAGDWTATLGGCTGVRDAGTGSASPAHTRTEVEVFARSRIRIDMALNRVEAFLGHATPDRIDANQDTASSGLHVRAAESTDSAPSVRIRRRICYQRIPSSLAIGKLPVKESAHGYDRNLVRSRNDPESTVKSGLEVVKFRIRTASRWSPATEPHCRRRRNRIGDGNVKAPPSLSCPASRLFRASEGALPAIP